MSSWQNSANWYDWNIAHWGTKWNAYSSRCDISTNTLIFTTANSSAYPVVKALSERYPDVYFKYRFADEDFGYQVAEFELSASERIRFYQPTGGTLEAQELAADILGIELKYDIERNYGFAPSLHGDHYEYCEGAYVSPSFQCDQSLGYPAVLCYDKDEGKVWLEMYPLLDEEDDMYKDIENSIKAWGVHSCRNFDDFKPVRPDSAYHKLKSTLKAARLPDIRFHDLRHTFASHAANAGIPPKTLSEILGHSKASFTLDTYAHVTTDMQRNAANIVTNYLTDILGKEMKPWENAKAEQER